MQITIKFRGKRIDNGELVYGDLIHYRKNDSRILEQNFGEWDILESGYVVIPKTVGQYTGLKDKNGVDIYEGDIVNFIGFKGTIEYDKEKLTFVIKWEADDIINLLENFSRRASTMFEVIGNIYDNPELLEVSK